MDSLVILSYGSASAAAATGAGTSAAAGGTGIALQVKLEHLLQVRSLQLRCFRIYKQRQTGNCSCLCCQLFCTCTQWRDPSYS